MPYSEPFLLEAIRLSEEKMELGEGGPFGAVVVKDGEIVGRGWNRVTTANDPTAHAEVEAIRQACANLGTFTLIGCDLYASCEPCPMCLSAIYWARLDTLYFAAGHDDAADAASSAVDDMVETAGEAMGDSEAAANEAIEAVESAISVSVPMKA